MSHSLAALLIGLALALVVVALATGLIGFAKGGQWYQRHANRLMQLRDAAQALAVALLALLLWLGR